MNENLHPEKQGVPVRAILKGMGLVILGVVLSELFRRVDLQGEGTWLTAQLKEGTDPKLGEVVYFEGPSLAWQNLMGELYTYCDTGRWVALDSEGYREGRNMWEIPAGLYEEEPECATSDNWSVDFFWPDWRGEFPEGAEPGTSSR